MGSTFSFTLPIPAGATVPPERTEPAAHEDERPTVVVVEDDPATRELVVQAIEACDVRVLSAGNGEDGLELVRTSRPDLVILDVVLPGVDGFEVAERIRADPAIAGVRLVMLTVVDDRDRADRLGVDLYVTKPFDADRLAAEVTALLPRNLGRMASRNSASDLGDRASSAR